MSSKSSSEAILGLWWGFWLRAPAPNRGFRPSCQMTPHSHLPFPLPCSASWSSTERAASGTARRQSRRRPTALGEHSR